MMMPNTAEKPSALTRAAWQAHAGDMPGAVTALYNEMLATPAMLNEIMPQVLRAWCRVQIEQHVGMIRAASLRQRHDYSNRSARLQGVFMATLFDFPLPGGKRLGDANAFEIREGAAAYQGTADDAAHKARWLARVAERVGRKNRVEGAVKLAELEALWTESEHE